MTEHTVSPLIYTDNTHRSNKMATSSAADQTTLLCRMIEMGKDSQLCMKFLALWMWLESNHQGFEGLIQNIASHSDEFITSVSEEAEAILSSLNLCSSGSNKSPSSLGMRNTLSLAQHFLPISAIIGDRYKVYTGIVSFYNEVCLVMFQDFLEERGINACLIEKKKRISVSSKLNPSAKEWSFVTERAPEEDRCLFLTFSNGYPLTENQIFRFFSQRYGKCVERVYVHWPEETKKNGSSENTSRRSSCELYVPALFGKVVFNASSIPAMILCGKVQVKFWVDDKPLWCKKYQPNKKYQSD